MFKLAVFTDEVSQDLQRVIEIAREFELKGLEIRSLWNKKGPQDLTSEDIKRIKEIVKGSGLTICSIASPFFKCNINSEEEYKVHLKILRDCISLAQQLDCPLIRGFTFWRKGNFEENLEKIISKFEEPIKILEKEGITLGIENEAATFIGNGKNLSRFLSKIDSPYIKAVWDPANSIFDPEGEVPYPDGYEAIKRWMVHMHLKDARRDSTTGEPKCVPVGKGAIDFRGQLKALKNDNYEGYVSLETHWRPEEELSEEEINLPGGEKFSRLAEKASRICLENLQKLMREITQE